MQFERRMASGAAAIIPAGGSAVPLIVSSNQSFLPRNQPSIFLKGVPAGDFRHFRFLARLSRLGVLALVLFGLCNARYLPPELLSGEVVENLVSVDSRRQECESCYNSDRELRLRKSFNPRGCSQPVLRRCCRSLSNQINHRPRVAGHRRPDNSVAPLLI